MTLLEIALAGLNAQWVTEKPGDPGHRDAALRAFLGNLACELELLSTAVGNDEEELPTSEIQNRILAAVGRLQAADYLFAHHLKAEVPNG